MSRLWKLAHGRSIELGETSVLMGILNITPDSFSDGGRFVALAEALDHAANMVGAGAAIIDIGGESTHPEAIAVSAEEEQHRVLPVIDALSRETNAILSVDTYRAETARLAVEAGAHIVNDIWGVQRDTAIADVAAATGAGLVLMHNGRDRDRKPDLIDDQHFFLEKSLAIADKAGVKPEQIVLDPGFGFAKDHEENLELLARFDELKAFGLPLVAATSRKRFIGQVTGREAGERDFGTGATSVLLRLAGASVFRVHDVAPNRDALRITDAMLARDNLRRR